MANKATSTVQMLSTKPGAAWREFKIGDTVLPMELPPLSIIDVRGEDGFPTGAYRVVGETPKGDEIVFADDVRCPFEAFEIMFARYREWFAQRPVKQVYFIGTELKVGHSIKVGVSEHPEARLRQLQTAHPDRLRIFATVPGDENLEAKYHRRWKARRRSGEWFTIGDCVIAEIARLSTPDQSEGCSHG